MRRKKVKGMVLENTGKNVILLAQNGEFLRLPAGGRIYSPGMEVEIEVPHGRKIPFLLPAAGVAAALFIAAALYLIQPALTTPEAYFALDINPSIVFSLDENATVIEAEPLNEDGEKVLEELEIEGADILEVTDSLLEAAYTSSYLSAGRDNVIIISLAAPENYGLGEQEVNSSVSKKLLQLEVDAYLKVTLTGLDEVRAAERMDIPLNAFILGEKMKEMEKTEKSRFLLEEPPPLPLQEFLQVVDPADIFGEDEFVAGEGRKDRGKPDISTPTPDIPGLPAEEKGEGEEKGPAGTDQGKPADKPRPLPPEAEQNIPVDLNGGIPVP